MKLFSTSIKNLCYSLSPKNKKTYYARFTVDNAKKIIKLSKNFTEARKKLSEIRDSVTIKDQLPQGINLDDIVDVLKDKIDDDYTITKKIGITYKELFYDYKAVHTGIESDRQLKEKTIKHENNIFNVPVENATLFGDLDLSDIRYSHCQLVINYLLENNSKPKTARNYKSAMSTVFKFGILEEYIDKNPVEFVKIPTFDNRKPFNLKPRDIKNLYHAIKTTRDEVFRLIFLFGFHGRRKSEVLNFEVSQIDLDDRIYSIEPQKNKSKRWFQHEMTDLLYSELKSYLDRYQPEGYLFINPNTNKPYTDIRRSFDDLKKRANIKVDFTFHDFRHLIGYVAINELNMTLEHVQSSLQHSDINVTQIYRDHHPKTSKEVTQAIINYAS